MSATIDRTQVSLSQHNPPAQTEKNDNEMSVSATLKAEMNISIMTSAKVTIGAQDESLTLLFNTAIDKINEQLAPELGENAIQKGYEAGLDISPDATAERIVSLSTVSYHAFKEQHLGEDDVAVLEKYIETISSGIDQGFGEARTILNGLDVLQGDIASNIDKTYELVQQKLATFKAIMMEQIDPQQQQGE